MEMKSRLTEQEKDFIQAMAESNLKFVRAARKVGLNNSEAENQTLTNTAGTQTLGYGFMSLKG